MTKLKLKGLIQQNVKFRRSILHFKIFFFWLIANKY